MLFCSTLFSCIPKYNFNVLVRNHEKYEIYIRLIRMQCLVPSGSTLSSIKAFIARIPVTNENI